MSLELLGIILNTCLTALIIFFIIWDHIKDDRLLTKQVQEFFWNIEGLVFTYYFYKLYSAFFSAFNDVKAKEFENYKTINYGEIDKQFENKLNYLRSKVGSGIKEFGKYLGLVMDHDEISSDTDMILTSRGELLDLNRKQIVYDFTNITQEKEGWDIYYYLRSLRFYWKNKYKRALLRKELKIDRKRHDIKKTFFDYEKCFEKLRIYQSKPIPLVAEYLVKYSNNKLVQAIEILKGSITTNPYHEERVYETLGLQFIKNRSNS